ncbi:MAG: UDP-glucose/GDP-mannose dehydrogenase family protein [Verrucomicrobiaceae bacterium]|nr:UDP-glucose/GDP-mannose dehydrogenase family protein [Verrucomicrobiaceae bacterium]
MNISVFGLGYVGAVTSGCLSEQGHRITGVDLQEPKVKAFNEGLSPIVEPRLGDILHAGHASGRISATTDTTQAVRDTDVSIICVGTPSLPSGGLELSHVRQVSAQIAAALRQHPKRHVILFRSTMLPGSTRALVEACFHDLLATTQIYYCPEFLREGTAVADFLSPSLSVVGTEDGKAPAETAITDLLGGAPEILRWEGAEMIKYSCNYLHALKVGFANEIGRLCKHVGEDGRRVMQVVCADTKLNISSYYMRPGNPFGGSCLPKDVSALRHFARQQAVSLPILESTMPSNEAHQQLFVNLVEKTRKRRVGLLGLAFKADTDDLRGSPVVAAAETLLGRGCSLSIYDPQINLSRLIGSNEQQIQERMPHLAQLLKPEAAQVLAESEVIIVSQKCVPLEQLRTLVRPDHLLIDVNGWEELKTLPCHYEGLCW